MNIEEIKNLYFNYYCDLSGLCRDIGAVNKDDIIRIVELNCNKWTKEFQKMIEDKIMNVQTVLEFSSLYAKYFISSKCYEDLYHLSEIIYHLIFNGLMIFEEVFSYYYDVVYNPKRICSQNVSIFDYFKINDIDKYNSLLEMTKVVLSKDSMHSKLYEKAKLISDHSS